EEQRPAGVHQVRGVRRAAQVDVLDHRRPGGRAVTPPQLPAVGPIVGGEEQGSANVDQVQRRRAATAGIDVLDDGGSGGSAVTLPKLSPMRSVIGSEEQ